MTGIGLLKGWKSNREGCLSEKCGRIEVNWNRCTIGPIFCRRVFNNSSSLVKRNPTLFAQPQKSSLKADFQRGPTSLFRKNPVMDGARLLASVFPDLLLSLDMQGAGDFLSIPDDNEGFGSRLIIPRQSRQSL